MHSRRHGTRDSSRRPPCQCRSVSDGSEPKIGVVRSRDESFLKSVHLLWRKGLIPLVLVVAFAFSSIVCNVIPIFPTRDEKRFRLGRH